MKVTAHTDGSYGLYMTAEELKALGDNGKKRLKALSMSNALTNAHHVYQFYGHHSLELALEMCRFYGLLVER